MQRCRVKRCREEIVRRECREYSVVILEDCCEDISEECSTDDSGGVWCKKD